MPTYQRAVGSTGQSDLSFRWTSEGKFPVLTEGMRHFGYRVGSLIPPEVGFAAPRNLAESTGEPCSLRRQDGWREGDNSLRCCATVLLLCWPNRSFCVVF